jgi:hypothetical protein
MKIKYLCKQIWNEILYNLKFWLHAGASRADDTLFSPEIIPFYVVLPQSFSLNHLSVKDICEGMNHIQQ